MATGVGRYFLAVLDVLGFDVSPTSSSSSWLGYRDKQTDMQLNASHRMEIGWKHVQLKLCEQTFQLANYHQNTRNVDANIDFALEKFKVKLKAVHCDFQFSFPFDQIVERLPKVTRLVPAWRRPVRLSQLYEWYIFAQSPPDRRAPLTAISALFYSRPTTLLERILRL